MDKIAPDERFSSQTLVEDLRKRHLEAFYFVETRLLLEEILRTRREGDVILFMSNGSFDNLPARLLAALGEE